ncbi:hypothetical protein [Candidatus Tisiphia endosymbiont of Parasteatoda lunata]
MSQHKKNISVKCKILLKNICMIHSYLFLINPSCQLNRRDER